MVRQTAHREPARPLVDYYGLLPKVRKLTERSVREEAGREGGGHTSSHFQMMKASTLSALRALQDVLSERQDYCGPEGYPGAWFGFVHGDLHGGNIMVDSRSYAWLIDYGEVEDAHVFKDPAKLETCILYIYTALPIPPRALVGARRAVRWWLGVGALPAIVEEGRGADRGETLPELRARRRRRRPPRRTPTPPPPRRPARPTRLAGVRDVVVVVGGGKRGTDVDEVMLRFAPAAECDAYLAEADAADRPPAPLPRPQR